MAESTIRDGGDGVRLVVVSRAARLIVGVLAGALVWPSSASGQAACPQGQARQGLLLEFDYFEGTLATTERPGGCVTTSNQKWTLEDTYCQGNLDLEAREDQIPRARGGPLSLPYRKACMRNAQIDRFLKETRDLDPASDQWYAHGLFLHGTGYYRRTWTPGGWRWMCTTGIKGLLWFLQQPGLCAGGVRENFVIFSGALGDKCDAFKTTVHELGHVLNLDHFELYHVNEWVESRGEFSLVGAANGPCRTHLIDHRAHGWEVAHVMPGCSGDPWCPASPSPSMLRHMNGPPPSHTQDMSWCSTAAARARVAANEEKGVGLTISPEKASYYPGEPIHVKVRLESAALKVVLRSEDALNPDLGFLTFFVGNSGKWEDMRPLRPAIYADPVPGHAPFASAGPIEEAGIGVWYTIPWSGIDLRRPFWLGATFAGFADRELVVTSKAVQVNVGIENPKIWSPRAYDLFTEEQSRRLLFLLGGDHLTCGIANLERIARDYPKTIYALYANLALGVMWANPSYGIDEDGAPSLRDADPDKARTYLLAAFKQKETLSPYYESLLRETLEILEKAGRESAEKKHRTP